MKILSDMMDGRFKYRAADDGAGGGADDGEIVDDLGEGDPGDENDSPADLGSNPPADDLEDRIGAIVAREVGRAIAGLKVPAKGDDHDPPGEELEDTVAAKVLAGIQKTKAQEDAQRRTADAPRIRRTLEADLPALIAETIPEDARAAVTKAVKERLRAASVDELHNADGDPGVLKEVVAYIYGDLIVNKKTLKPSSTATKTQGGNESQARPSLKPSDKQRLEAIKSAAHGMPKEKQQEMIDNFYKRVNAGG